jgi:hypothetical protein
MSTHKTMSGPVGGVLITNDDAIAERILGLTFPALIQTRDQNKYAAQAYVLAELTAFGRAYARQTIANAQALGAALERAGFTVLGGDRGYTRTHQIYLDLRREGAARCEAVCQAAGLLLHVSRLMGDGPDARNGARLAVHLRSGSDGVRSWISPSSRSGRPVVILPDLPDTGYPRTHRRDLRQARRVRSPGRARRCAARRLLWSAARRTPAHPRGRSRTADPRSVAPPAAAPRPEAC